MATAAAPGLGQSAATGISNGLGERQQDRLEAPVPQQRHRARCARFRRVTRTRSIVRPSRQELFAGPPPRPVPRSRRSAPMRAASWAGPCSSTVCDCVPSGEMISPAKRQQFGLDDGMTGDRRATGAVECRQKRPVRRPAACPVGTHEWPPASCPRHDRRCGSRCRSRLVRRRREMSSGIRSVMT